MNTTKFSEMPAEERTKLIEDIGEMLIKHDLPAEVKVVQEVVYNMQETKGEHNVSCVVKKEMPNSLKDKVDAFNAEVKTLTDGKEGVSIGPTCTVAAGMPY